MGNKRDWSKIGEVVEKIKEQGLNYRNGAKEFGIKVRDIYEYNKVIGKKRRSSDKSVMGDDGGKEEEGTKECSDKEEKRKSSPSGSDLHLPDEIQQIIIKYRNDHPDHGYKRIEDHLKNNHFVVVSRKKIRKVLKAHGLAEMLDSSFDRADESCSSKGTRRFEADYPRDLYQMDVTYVYITGISVLYLVVIVDDYSRFCVAAELRRDQRGTTMIEVVHRAIEQYGRPRRILTDQGRNFYSWSHEGTVFQKYLDDMEIEHIVADPHSPQTCGKVERFIQTCQQELFKKVQFNSYNEARRGIEDYVHSYNYDRSHQGIDGACPSGRFHGVRGETARIESNLSSKSLDFSKGYLIFKNQDHTLSVVISSSGLQVLLDGNLLKGGIKDDKH